MFSSWTVGGCQRRLAAGSVGIVFRWGPLLLET